VTLLQRLGAYVLALAIGLFYGAAGAFAHSIVVGGWLPLGLIVALIGSTALLLALRLLSGDRWTVLAAALGMMGATWVLAQTSAGGSIIFSQLHPVLANVWMIVVPLVAAVIVAWPELSRARRARQPVTHP